MSGRVWVDLADGRRVRGYRKTLRKNPRGPAAQPIEYRLIFQLPREIAWTVPEGPHGTFVDVGRMANATVKSYDRDTTLRAAAEFLQAVGRGHELHVGGVMQTARGHDTVQMVLHRGDVIQWYGAGKATIYRGHGRWAAGA